MLIMFNPNPCHILIESLYQYAVHFRNKERITFDHLVSMKKAGETGLVKVLRHGQEVEFTIKLGPVCYFSFKFKLLDAKSKLIKQCTIKAL